MVAILMLANAGLFTFAALQHAGVAFGPVREPVILPASIVELLCAAALTWGAAARSRRGALIGNAAAMAGVAIGIVALAVGAGPRTASNDLHHGMMLGLAAAALAALRIPAKDKTQARTPVRTSRPR